MIRIFIESGINHSLAKGKKTTNEQDFIKTFIMRHFPQAKPDIDFEILGTGGKDKIGNMAPTFKDNTISGGTNIVIFDADSPQNEGGLSKRRIELLKQKEFYEIEFELFLWPNNHADGDFETLLLNLTQPKHHGLIDCYRRYEKGIKKLNKKRVRYMTQGRKGCIYNYIASMKKSRTENERFKQGCWNFNNPEYWNLENEHVQPLARFLEQFF